MILYCCSKEKAFGAHKERFNRAAPLIIPADGLATTLQGSTFHINKPVEHPTANSLAK